VDDLAYGETASGAVGAVFCYRVIVANTSQVAALDVEISDPTIDGTCNSTVDIDPGEIVTNVCYKSYPGFTGTKVNTATARTICPLDQSEISVSDTASVTLSAPSIACTKYYNGVQATGGFDIPLANNTCTDLTVSVTIRNNGSLDLQDVTVSNASDIVECQVSGIIIDALPVGASTNITLCTTTLCCPTNGVNSATASDEVFISAVVSTNVCARLDENCEPIGVSNSCPGSVSVSCTPPGACRTTGGGKQIPNNLTGDKKEWACQSSAVSTPPPLYVTHGGQLGAPYAVGAVCVTNTPCIWGEWQHVRHIKGGLRGVFHASSNGRVHDFDSLGCACLPCSELAEVVASPSPGVCASSSTPVSLDYTNEIAVTQGKRHELCNAGERTCGPEPRRAPANKIAFSGIGDYALTKGKKDRQSVVFRVDIEDRSEPGGKHPGGATPPADRYRIRIWFLKGNEGGNAADPTTLAALQLRCAVAVKDPLIESVDACRPPDIDDGGALDRGNRQLHPNTGATPPTDCGSEIDPGPCGGD
jgi:hypothetical protein